MTLETAFVLNTSNIKYGPGATREVGYDMQALGAKRVMVVADPHLVNEEPVEIAMQALKAAGVETVLYDGVRIEPTDVSFKEAIAFATDGRFDGYVAIGGGSTMDTAKAANLYTTYPADFLTYVNAPIGEGRPVPGKLSAADRHPYHCRNGQRDDRYGDIRPAGNARQDRDRPPGAAPGDRHR